MIGHVLLKGVFDPIAFLRLISYIELNGV